MSLVIVIAVYIVGIIFAFGYYEDKCRSVDSHMGSAIFWPLIAFFYVTIYPIYLIGKWVSNWGKL